MAGELFKAMAGIDVVHVPYRNSGEARTGVIGGQVQMMIDAVPTMAPNVAGSQVHALATTGKSRSSVLPNVPTACRGRRRRLRGDDLARIDGAGGNAEACHRQAQRRR